MKVSVLGLVLLLAPLASAQTEALPPGDDEAHWAAVEQQREREIGLLQGKKITQIDIVGLNEEQRKNAEIFLQLGRIKGETIGGGGVNAEYAQYLLEQGPTQIGQSQQPFGYYNSRVHYELLPGKNGELTVRYRVELGPPVRLQNVQVAVAGAAEGDPPFQQLLRENPLRPQQVLNHQDYEGYKGKFEALGLDRGYFDGDFDRHEIAVNTDDQRANLDLRYQSGPRYRYGPATFRSRDGSPLPLDQDFLQRYVQTKYDAPYLASEMSQLQQDLQSSDYFSEVLVGGEPNRDSKTIPIDTQLTMNKRKRYVYGLGYATDVGVRGKFTHQRRWVNSRGHQFSLNAQASMKDSNFEALYRLPAKLPASDYYYGRVGGQYKTLDYRNSHLYAEGGYELRRGKWASHYSLTASNDNFRIGSDRGNITLLYPRGRWTYTSTSNRLDPKDGWQVQLEALGAFKGLVSEVSFLQSNLNWRYLHSFSPKQRLIIKGNNGALWTESFHRLPPRFRYFAGGDRSVRGYDFERLGTRDANGTNIGGRYKLSGTAEYEYYLRDDLALAAFVDGGDAFKSKPKIKVGAGVGVHYYSPVGPIRLDLGHGFDRQLGDKIRMHLTIGAELDL